MEEVKGWRSRPLEPLYAIVYLDPLYVKMLTTVGLVVCAQTVEPGILSPVLGDAITV